MGLIYYNPNTYEIGTNAPIDSRYTKPTNVERDAIPNAVRYEGLAVYVADPAGNGSIPGTQYMLIGGIANANWTSTSSVSAYWALVSGDIKSVGTPDVYIATSLKVPKIKPSADSTTAIQVTKANGTSVVLNIDTTNTRLGINMANPAYEVDTPGSIRAGVYLIGQEATVNTVKPAAGVTDLYLGTRNGASSDIILATTGNAATESVRIKSSGNVGIGVQAPTARLHLMAGTLAANTAPLKLDSGVLLTTPEVGAIEFVTDAFYATITTGVARKQFAFRETTLAGYGITNGLKNTTDTMTGYLTLDYSSAAPTLYLKHNYTTNPLIGSNISWINESNVLLASVGIEPTNQNLELYAVSGKLIVATNAIRANLGVQFTDSTTSITRDGSNNLSFTDAVSGTKTLAQLLAAHVWTINGNDIYNANSGNVGVGATPTTGYKFDVDGKIRYTGLIRSAVSGSDIFELESKSASGYDFRLYNITKSVDRLNINTSGYVGINTNGQTDQFAVAANTTAIYAGNFANAHITGKGLYIAGANGTNPALFVGNYQGTRLLEVLGNGVVNLNRIQLDITGASPTNAEGLLWWDQADGTMNIGMMGGAITQQVGQELFFKVYNLTGSIIPDGVPVYVTGTFGNYPAVGLAKSDVESTSAVVGVVTEPIPVNGFSYVTTEGYVRGIKTDYTGTGNWGTTWIAGMPLYLSKSVAGQLTNVEPPVPHHADIVAYVAIIGGIGVGSVYVHINRHKTLEELTDVDGTPLTTSGQLPVWNNSAKYFDFNYNLNDYATDLELQQVSVDKNRFGFINRTDTSISFDGTSVFTLAGTTWSYYRSGIKCTISGNKTVTVATPMVDATLYFIYIDSITGALISAPGSWTLQDTKVPVATMYWNSTQTPKFILCDERHTCTIDRAYHYIEHFTEGTKVIEGGAITGMVVGSVVPAEKTCGITGISVVDEDLKTAPADLPDPDGATAVYYILYRTSATTWAWKTSDMPFDYTGTVSPFPYLRYDLNGTMTPSVNNRWVNTYLFVTNAVANNEATPGISTTAMRYVIIPGRGSFNTAALAYAESFASFGLTGFPFVEGTAVYQFTWDTSGVANTVKGRCKLDRQPVRVSSNVVQTAGVSSVVHNSLSGLDGGTAGEYYHLTVAQHTIATQPADTTNSGYLTTTDWDTFNLKSGNAYTNATPMPQALGGLGVGSTFLNKTIYEMFDMLLYPYQVPAFFSFVMSGQATTLECGIFITTGVKTFTWGTTNSTNVQANSLVITDFTTSTILGSGLANDGTEALNIGAAITKTTTAQNHQWRIDGNDSRPIAMTPNYFTVTWYSPFYYGVGAAGLSVANIQALTKAVVAKANYTRSFSPTSQKFYYAYPASYGTLTSIIDPNGFNITADWTLTVVNFTTNSPNYEGGTVSYNVYEYNNLTTQTGFNITFNF